MAELNKVYIGEDKQQNICSIIKISGIRVLIAHNMNIKPQLFYYVSTELWVIVSILKCISIHGQNAKDQSETCK